MPERRLAGWGVVLLLVGVVAGRLTLFETVRVGSDAMVPGVLPGEVLWVWKGPLADPVPGRVVLFEIPGEGVRYAKRIVAGEGTRVEVHDGRLLLDGAPAADGESRALELSLDGCSVSTLDVVQEPWGPVIPGGPDHVSRVDAGAWFVLADHRAEGSDSRHWGTVAPEQIRGTAARVVWSRQECSGAIRWDRLGAIP